MRRQREQLAVGRNKAAALEREEDAARGGTRQLRGAREITQCHRTAGGAEFLQQPQAAVETLDEVGGTLLAVTALQLWHVAFRKASRRSKIVLAVPRMHVIIRPIVQ